MSSTHACTGSGGGFEQPVRLRQRSFQRHVHAAILNAQQLQVNADQHVQK